MLHVDDLCDLILLHLSDPSVWDGRMYVVGGGLKSSTSLAELTEICRQETGRDVPLASEPETASTDVPIYLSDHTRISRHTGWKPQRGVREIVADTARWIEAHESTLERIF